MAKKQETYINAKPDMLEHPYADRLIIPYNIRGKKKHYLYIHCRRDKNEPFYIGIGTKYRRLDYDRALDYKKRSEFWKRVSKKTKYWITIVDESDDYEEIKKKEINYIALFGKRKNKSGILVNLTDGGEGLLGHSTIWTDEMKDKIREANRKRIFKDSTREKLRQLIRTRNFFNKKNNNREVLQIDIVTKDVIREFESSAEAARFHNVTPSSINFAVRKGKESVGFKWIYKYDNKKERTLNRVRA